MASGLEASDRVVDATEILAQGVRRREVILSACSTGWRPYKVGDLDLLADDIIGLPGAMLEGGASSILVSIPPTEDEPMRRLVVEYHAARRRGLRPIPAVAAAQRGRLTSGDPVWGWGGTVVYGCW
jgi:CHAT domain-containing protein